MADETLPPPATSDDPSPRGDWSDMPRQIGRYHVLERVGEGGMGTVYKAEQRHPIRRTIAIKIIKPGFDTREVIARFESERQALARMDHPNIARVLDAGSTENGHPYFVMEYVPGRPITQFADENKLTIPQRLELFMQVCDAVTHAHTKAIIHRDLKAGNVLAMLKDGVATVKVIDFGVAKALTADRLTDQTFNTASGVVVGTYNSMSPEQADGSPDIDTRTDVYSLGVLLYELLTGVTPFDHLTMAKVADIEIRRMIREVEPMRPSTRLSTMGDRAMRIAAARQQKLEELQKNLKHELEWIPLKAMSKERARRYSSAVEMGMDLGNYLAGRPLLAAPDSRGYLLRKFVRRHRGPLIAASLVGLALMLGIAGTTLGFFREHRAVAEARTQRTEAVAAKGEAESQARLARKAAALSDARYLIQQASLPEAIDRIREADAIGLDFNERLVLDETYKAARGQWKLINRIDTQSRSDVSCFVKSASGADLILFAVGRRVYCQKVGSSDSAGSVELDSRPDELIPTAGAGGVVLARRGSTLCAIDPEQMKVIATKPLGSPIVRMAASQKMAAIVQDGGMIRLLDAHTLEENRSWPWTAVARIVPFTTNIKFFLSPDDHWIFLHNGAWNKPIAAIHIASGAVHQIDNVRMGHLVFSSQSPERFLTWFSPSLRGGLPDQLLTYQINKDATVEKLTTLTVDSSETKERAMVRWSREGRIVLFGQVGLAEIGGEYSRAEPVSQRYRSLWPFDEDNARLLIANADGDTVALAASNAVLVFSRDEQARSQINLEDFNSCAIPNGMLAAFNADLGRIEIQFSPFEPARPNWTATIGWLTSGQKDRRWLPWLFHVTTDTRHAVIIGQESDGEDTVSNNYFRKCALIYDTANGLDQVASWKPIRRFDMPELEGIHGIQNRVVRLTPDGAVLTFGTESESNLVLRYDTATGKHLSTYSMTPEYEVSSDGQFLAGKLRSSDDLVVMRLSDGGNVCTIPMKGEAFSGCCFSSQNKLLLISRGHREVEAIDLSTGASLWKRPCMLVPRAWHESNGVFIAYVPEASGLGGMFVLADQATLKPLSVLSRTADLRNDTGFSPDGKTLYFQASRWFVQITRAFELGEMLDSLHKPLVMQTAAIARDAAPSPMLVIPPLPAPSTAPLTTAGAIAATDSQALVAKMGQTVTIEGVVSRLNWTRGGDAINVEFAGARPVEHALLLWIPPPILTQIRAAGIKIDQGETSIEGKRVVVRGRITRYGGYTDSWKNRPEITPASGQDFHIFEK